MLQSMKEPFHQFSNCLMLPQFLKKVKRTLKTITFENIMYNQMATFMEKYFSKFQCGFRKRYSTQQCLIALTKKWKSVVDGGKSFETLLTDLSRAFDCLTHELLLANLNAYGFSLSALRLICNYLFRKQQRN